MGESGETERQGDTVSVEKDEGEQIQVLTPEEAKMKAARVKKMEYLRMKLRTTKGQMTKNMNKLEQAITAYEKAETEGGSATKIKSKAEDIKLYLCRQNMRNASNVKNIKPHKQHLTIKSAVKTSLRISCLANGCRYTTQKKEMEIT